MLVVRVRVLLAILVAIVPADCDCWTLLCKFVAIGANPFVSERHANNEMNAIIIRQVRCDARIDEWLVIVSAVSYFEWLVVGLLSHFQFLRLSIVVDLSCMRSSSRSCARLRLASCCVSCVVIGCWFHVSA